MIINILSNGITSTIDIKHNSILYNIMNSFKKSYKDIFIIASRINSDDSNNSHEHTRRLMKIINNYILSDIRYFDEYYIELIKIGINYITNENVKIFDCNWYNENLLGTKVTNYNKPYCKVDESNFMIDELFKNLITRLNLVHSIDKSDCPNKIYETQGTEPGHIIDYAPDFPQHHTLHNLNGDSHFSYDNNLPWPEYPLDLMTQITKQQRRNTKKNKKIEYKGMIKQKNNNIKSQLKIKKKFNKNYK